MTSLRELEKLRKEGEVTTSLPLEAVFILRQAHEDGKNAPPDLKEDIINAAISKVKSFYPDLFIQEKPEE